jgi:branched-chain amino acid transport system ATP-binding protein
VVASFHLDPKCGFWEGMLNTTLIPAGEGRILDEAMEILRLVGLEREKGYLGQEPASWSAKAAHNGKGLGCQAQLLLLDEPIGGMHFDEVNRAISAIERIRSQGTTIVLVEHNMRLMRFCERIVVMDFGEKIAEGTYEEVKNHEHVMRAYFGHEYAT